MNSTANNNGSNLLVIGDVLVYFFSLIVTLAIRYGAIPDRNLFMSHIPSFTFLIIAFIIVTFSAGLYDKQVAFIRKQIQGILFRVQLVNIFIGIVFFYLAPVGIAPKANLVIYFIVSTILLFIWRTIMFPVLSVSKKERSILIGSGADMEDLKNEINSGYGYGIYFKDIIESGADTNSLQERVKSSIDQHQPSVIVADLHDSNIESLLPYLHTVIFSGIKVIDASKLYESIFDKIPLSMVGEKWLVENSATALGNRRVYDILKRVIDVVTALFGGIITLLFYPFIILAIKLDDGGPIFIFQDRIGFGGKVVRIIKFRSMSGNDNGNYNNGISSLKITRVGKFLRNSRLDEVPQFWNILLGDLSLVGPRPELPKLVEVYKKEIPYYNVRHLVKPGACGWAQIYHENHPHHGVATEDSKEKLTYDLYYIKNRSLFLDIKIIFRTVQILMKRVGR